MICHPRKYCEKFIHKMVPSALQQSFRYKYLLHSKLNRKSLGLNKIGTNKITSYL